MKPPFDYQEYQDDKRKRWSIIPDYIGFCDLCGNHLELKMELQQELPHIMDKNLNLITDDVKEGKVKEGKVTAEDMEKHYQKSMQWTNALNKKIAEKGNRKKLLSFDGGESGHEGAICLDCVKKLFEEN